VTETLVFGLEGTRSEENIASHSGLVRAFGFVLHRSLFP
jgi:hypothetical protein